jgi:nuclear RNA export factor
MLDMDPVVPAPAQMPQLVVPPIYPGIMDQPTSAATATAFLQAYYALFDGDRRALLPYYDSTARFSLAINYTPLARETNISSRVNRDPFDGWSAQDHNLDSVKLDVHRTARQFIGPESINKALREVPRTSHPIHSPPEQQLFCVEAYQVTPTTLVIHLHGELSCTLLHTFNTEATTKTTYKLGFDRTFVLVPSQPGSPAHAAQLPVSIVNDMLGLRHFSPGAWRKVTEFPMLAPANVLHAYKPLLGLVPPHTPKTNMR